MTERELPSVDGAPACPFVAFEDDRESRSTSPDRRHRCYAEPVPSSRAAAHQEAYCLSSAFPVCPTFQDWAKREAAHARGEGERPAPAPNATANAEGASPPDQLEGDQEHDDDLDERSRINLPIDEIPIRRNPPRDWAAPPPWAPGGAAALGAASGQRPADSRGAAGASSTPDFLAGRAEEGRGLAGSAADRLASGADPSQGPDTRPSRVDAAAPADAEIAGLVAPRRAGERAVHDPPLPQRPGNRPRVSSSRSVPRDAIVGPSWERSRRDEAYPVIRARMGLPPLPRVAGLAVALAIAALGLFFLPALLGMGSGGRDSATSSPSPIESFASSSPALTTAQPAPTAEVYVVKAGDTLSKIAAKFGLKPAELCAANKDTVTNCDKIAIGAELVIPSTPPDVINDASPEPSPS